MNQWKFCVATIKQKLYEISFRSFTLPVEDFLCDKDPNTIYIFSTHMAFDIVYVFLNVQ